MKREDPFSAVRGPSPTVVAAMFGVPVERVREQYRRNAVQLREMAERAGDGVYRGYDRAHLIRLAEAAEAKAGQ